MIITLPNYSTTSAACCIVLDTLPYFKHPAFFVRGVVVLTSNPVCFNMYRARIKQLTREGLLFAFLMMLLNNVVKQLLSKPRCLNMSLC